MIINFYENCSFEVSESTIKELLEFYEKEKPLSSGRGTSKLIDYKGQKYILKKEARGGLFSLILPDYFFSLSPFYKEIEINNIMEQKGLTIPIVLRFGKRHNILWEIFTLTKFIDDCVSLKQITLDEAFDEKRVVSAGSVIAKMHKIGLYHSDLNIGNIIFSEKGTFIIDFKNSYFYSAPLNKTLARKNLIRLFQSYIKERTKVGRQFNEEFFKFFIEGYFNERGEDWVKEISTKNLYLKIKTAFYQIKFKRQIH